MKPIEKAGRRRKPKVGKAKGLIKAIAGVLVTLNAQEKPNHKNLIIAYKLC